MRNNDNIGQVSRNSQSIRETFAIWGRKLVDFFGKEKELSQTGLLEIPIQCEEKTKGNIVFVHGLGADRRLTWHCQTPKQPDWDENNFWPYWLGEELPGFKIWLFGYEAKKFFLESGQAAPRYDQARNLLAYLKTQQLEQYPLWFVTHSLGGLVVKQMLRVADDNNEPIRNQVRGVVFLATPHVGSDLVKFRKIVKTISVNLLSVTKTVKELESHDPGLRDLDDWYRNNAESLKISTLPFYEMYNTWGVRVVDEDSANPKVNSQEFFTPVEADHIEIAKCRSKKIGIVYPTVKKFIEDTSLTDTLPIKSHFKSETLQQIDEEEANTERNNHSIDNNKIDDSKLYKALVRINFTEECNHVRNYLSHQMIGSFLICGEKKKGINIFLERLYSQKTYFLISIDLSGSQAANIPILWTKVAKAIELEEKDEIDKILSRIIEIQQKQSILFVLKHINEVSSQEIGEVMSEFWKKLIEKISCMNRDIANNNVCLFLVDYQNRYRDIDFDQTLNKKLLLNDFSEQAIGDWIDSVRIEWGAEECDELGLDSNAVSEIFRDSQGVPNRVYRNIYEYFKLAWKQSKMIRQLEM